MRLPELQARIADALRGGEIPADLLALIADDGIDPARRLGIHRNHVRQSIAAALAANFPTVEALVGAEFFRRAAQEFTDEAPPESPCLEEHGAGFADFLARFPPAASLAYLPDVVRLDRIRLQAALAPGERTLDAAALSALDPAARAAWRPVLTGSCALLASDWPIDAIWRFVHEAGGEGRLDLDSGGQAVLVSAVGGEVRQRLLSAGGTAFIAALAAGCSLEEALAAAQAAEPALDLGVLLAGHLDAGHFSHPEQRG